MRKFSPGTSLPMTTVQFLPLELEAWLHFCLTCSHYLHDFFKLKIMKSNYTIIETSFTLVYISLES